MPPGGLNEVETAYWKRNAVFSGMDGAFFSRALQGARVKVFRAGEVVMAAGEQMQALGVLVKGEADVFKRTEAEGEGALLMSVLRPSEAFGAATMFLKNASAATEVRTRRGCKAILFPEPWLKTLMREDFSFAENYIAYLTARVHFLTGRLESIASPTAAEKLMNHLAQSAQDGVVRLPHGMRALAESLSISRASLYRVMDGLEREGRLRREGKNIYLGGY
ncbi:MAG: Crp/Fnr family transcriptional regulator [Clostridiaceae bacterium]|nr:Crp/Fnr family transcriptional regulator [Eubacteriales bacterium]